MADDYTVDDVGPAATPAPAQNGNDYTVDDVGSPPAQSQMFLADDPKYTYSTFFPFRNETNPADRKTASQSGGVLPFIGDHLAVPEAIRAPVRGAIQIGQDVMGNGGRV